MEGRGRHTKRIDEDEMSDVRGHRRGKVDAQTSSHTVPTSLSVSIPTQQHCPQSAERGIEERRIRDTQRRRVEEGEEKRNGRRDIHCIGSRSRSSHNWCQCEEINNAQQAQLLP